VFRGGGARGHWLACVRVTEYKILHQAVRRRDLVSRYGLIRKSISCWC